METNHKNHPFAEKLFDDVVLIRWEFPMLYGRLDVVSDI